MTMRLALGVGLLVFASCAQAQVMEVGANGEVRTFDGPTVFTADGATSLRDKHETMIAPTDDTASLLTQAAQYHRLDPELLKAVAWQESNGRVQAVSAKGARGIMQLMPATATELGVDLSDPAENIRGGAIYLRQQLDRFRSVPLALAAYNAGPGAVIRYGGVPPFRETQSYVMRIMRRWHPTSAWPPAAPAAPAQPPSDPLLIEVP